MGAGEYQQAKAEAADLGFNDAECGPITCYCVSEGENDLCEPDP